MVMGDDDFLVSVGSSFELVLEPGPFCGGVVLEFREVADQRDGIQKNEAVSLVAEGAVVTDIVVRGELLQCLDAADIVVPGEQVNWNIEVGQGFLESLDFVVVPAK